MAAKKTIDEEVMEQPVKKKEVDPWEQKITVQVPKSADGSANYLIASCNGKTVKIMKGVKVDVPAPIAEVLEHMFEAEEEAELFIASKAN